MHPRLFCVGFINFYCPSPMFLRQFVTGALQNVVWWWWWWYFLAWLPTCNKKCHQKGLGIIFLGVGPSPPAQPLSGPVRGPRRQTGPSPPAQSLTGPVRGPRRQTGPSPPTQPVTGPVHGPRRQTGPSPPAQSLTGPVDVTVDAALVFVAWWPFDQD